MNLLNRVRSVLGLAPERESGLAWASGLLLLAGGIGLALACGGRTAQAQREEMVITYQKAINSAFQDVSNALVGYQKNREYSVSQTEFAQTLREQSRLANVRYVGGVSSYLEVLDTERQRLTAEQQLAQAQRDVLTSLVQLYKALGGGWQ